MVCISTPTSNPIEVSESFLSENVACKEIKRSSVGSNLKQVIALVCVFLKHWYDVKVDTN